MKASTLRKYDDVLTAEERFRLALAAMARDDESEVRRLQATCPRHTYTMTALDFADRWHGSHRVVMAFCVAWLWNQTQFVQAQWFIAAREAAVAEGLTTATATEVVERCFQRGRELKSVYVALLRFSAAARLDWRELLQWWPPIIDEIEMVRPILDSETFDPPEELTDATYRLLVRVWQVPIDATAGEGTAA
jgi:hypothetical protein